MLRRHILPSNMCNSLLHILQVKMYWTDISLNFDSGHFIYKVNRNRIRTDEKTYLSIFRCSEAQLYWGDTELNSGEIIPVAKYWLFATLLLQTTTNSDACLYNGPIQVSSVWCIMSLPIVATDKATPKTKYMLMVSNNSGWLREIGYWQCK